MRAALRVGWERTQSVIVVGVRCLGHCNVNCLWEGIGIREHRGAVMGAKVGCLFVWWIAKWGECSMDGGMDQGVRYPGT